MLLLLVSSVAFVRDASAATQQYCRVLVDPHTYCWDEPFQRYYTLNVVFYPGSGSVSVCEKVRGPDLNQISLRCGTNYANSGTDTHPYQGKGLRLNCGNNSNNRHTLNCRGDY